VRRGSRSARTNRARRPMSSPIVAAPIVAVSGER
jgi:hypothetical protein